MKPVIIDSPFAGDVPLNRAYLQACIRDCLKRGETPYASHQMLTWALDDLDPEQRMLGMSAGIHMRDFICEHGGRSVYYVDLGWSSGMRAARGELTDVEERLILDPREWTEIIVDAGKFYGANQFRAGYVLDLVARFRDKTGTDSRRRSYISHRHCY